MEMYLNSYVPVYPVPTSPATSLASPLKRNVHLRETIPVTKRETGGRKEENPRNDQVRFPCNEQTSRVNVSRDRTPWGGTGRKGVADGARIRIFVRFFAICNAQRDVDEYSTPFRRRGHGGRNVLNENPPRTPRGISSFINPRLPVPDRKENKRHPFTDHFSSFFCSSDL